MDLDELNLRLLPEFPDARTVKVGEGVARCLKVKRFPEVSGLVSILPQD